MQAIVTLTMNPAIDTSSSVDYVVPDRKLRCKPPRFEPGGGGINVVRALRKLAGQGTAFYPAGGPTGQILRDMLERERVSHNPIPIEGWTRENFNLLNESTGQQLRFVMPGPSMTEFEWQRCLDVLMAIRPFPSYIVVSGSLPPGVPDDFYVRVAHLAKDRDSRIVVDSSGAALRRVVNAGVYLLKASLRELGHLAGQEITTEALQEEVARQLVERGLCEIVLLSLGAEGGLMVTAQGKERVRPPTVPVRSMVGAGDSMVAGFLLSLVRGGSTKDAFRYGVAAGTASVMNPGTELCELEATERLFEQLVCVPK